MIRRGEGALATVLRLVPNKPYLHDRTEKSYESIALNFSSREWERVMFDLVVTHWFRLFSALIGGSAGLKAAEEARRAAEAKVAEEARAIALSNEYKSVALNFSSREWERVMFDLVVTHWFRLFSALIGGSAGLKAAQGARRVADDTAAAEARHGAEAKAAEEGRRAAEAKAAQEARRVADAKCPS
jgi:hypothetical protein